MTKLPILLIFIILTSTILYSQTTYTYRSPESKNDRRYDYDNALLKLALDKTLKTDGDYILKPSPQMNFKRMFEYIKSGKLINPIFKNSASNQLCEEYDYINFPVDLGIVGYRLFFVSPDKNMQFESVKTLEDLRNFKMIQGAGWKDIEILRNSGFDVKVSPKYENLFIEVVKNKVDLFPRGMNEILDEMSNHKNLKGLSFNSDIILYYPLPRFFYTSKGNEEALDRVSRGIWIAYEDGSLVKLWEKYYGESIKKIGTKNKTIITITNPLVSDVDKSYEKYLFKF
ncbi:MAG: hypothetical protein OCD02_15365 [Spirochaetaceae bacterium]